MFRMAILCFIVHCTACITVVAEDTIQEIVNQSQMDLAEKRLMKFLDRESDFPDRFAVESVVDVTTLNSSVHMISFIQVIVFDDKARRWQAFHEGRKRTETNTSVFSERAYFDGQELWVARQKSGIFPPSDWQKYDQSYFYDFPFFHPRFVWLCHVASVGRSLNVSSFDVLGGRDCVGVKREKNRLQTAWAYKQTAELNRITELYFGTDELPNEAHLLPSLNGNFDLQEVEKITKSSEFKQTSTLDWKRNAKDPPVLDQVTMHMSLPDRDTEITMKNRWLLGKAIDSKFFEDPRSPNAMSLEELNFAR